MRIEIKGRNVAVSDELERHVARRFRVVDRQVSKLASLEVELIQEQKPGIAEGAVATAALHLKGVTLRASSRARELDPAINQLGQELTVQVKRHRDKRRKRRDARVAGGERRPAPLTDREAPPVGV